MGKKPVVGLFGLVWAGIALTGCGECARNCRNTYNPRPMVQTKDGTGPKAPPVDGKGSGMELPPAKPPEPPGLGRSLDERPLGGPGAAPVGAPVAPREAKSLRAPMETTGLGALEREGQSAPLPDINSGNRRITMPARPPVRSQPPADVRPSDPPVEQAPPVREGAPLPLPGLAPPPGT